MIHLIAHVVVVTILWVIGSALCSLFFIDVFPNKEWKAFVMGLIVTGIGILLAWGIINW